MSTVFGKNGNQSPQAAGVSISFGHNKELKKRGLSSRARGVKK
jgi:hypothetical protein